MFRYLLPLVPVVLTSSVALAQPRSFNVSVQKGITVNLTNNTGQPVSIEVPGRIGTRTLANRAAITLQLKPNESVLYTPTGNFLIRAAASLNAPRNTLSLVLTETRSIGQDTRSLFIDPSNKILIF
ncbi:hypothetical protein GlitD10_0598 [Gloeomargarita lithophora Alchichica-D10]|uniref:Uncharacterized protein n=1 Tax=Gloeomargarita lithophora Alchichica-D10 TaxID=1188229 RepID=A0A1J0AAE3_9CYAN|nr:hypothetical protein [Gloeomargarita lithophora]APB32912.1 hypothetical protein GlitD10_0598 [Gloeomargarita lithophora Alchichica-D10]